MLIDRLAFIALCLVAGSLALGNSLYQISSGIFTGLVLISVLRERRFDVHGRAFLALMALYWAAAALSIVNSAHLEPSLRGLLKLTRSLLLCAGAAHVLRSPRRLRTVLWVLMAVAALVAFDALAQSQLGRDLLRGRTMTPYEGSVKRLTGPFHHANDFSAYLSFVTVLCAGLARAFRSARLWALAFGLGACLIGTYSRGAWLAAALAFILMAFYSRSRTLIACVAALTLWALWAAPDAVQARWQSLWNPSNNTVSERRELWGESLRMIRQRPLTGLGLNTYSRNAPLYKAPGSLTDIQYAHNGYLQIAAETGLLGLSAFLALMAYCVLGPLARFARDPLSGTAGAGTALAFACLSFLIHSGSDTNLQSMLLVNTLWLGLGVLHAAVKLHGPGAA